MTGKKVHFYKVDLRVKSAVSKVFGKVTVQRIACTAATNLATKPSNIYSS